MIGNMINEAMLSNSVDNSSAVHNYIADKNESINNNTPIQTASVQKVNTEAAGVKMSDALKTFGNKMSQHAPIQMNQAQQLPYNTMQINNASPNIPQQSQIPNIIPQMSSIPQMNALSDKNSKHKIKYAEQEMNNLLNSVYQNLVNKKVK